MLIMMSTYIPYLQIDIYMYINAVLVCCSIYRVSTLWHKLNIYFDVIAVYYFNQYYGKITSVYFYEGFT